MNEKSNTTVIEHGDCDLNVLVIVVNLKQSINFYAIATKTQTVLPLSLQNVVNFQDKQKPKPNRMLERDFSFMHIVNSIYMLYMYTFVLFARCLS